MRSCAKRISLQTRSCLPARSYVTFSHPPTGSLAGPPFHSCPAPLPASRTGTLPVPDCDSRAAPRHHFVPAWTHRQRHRFNAPFPATERSRVAFTPGALLLPPRVSCRRRIPCLSRQVFLGHLQPRLNAPYCSGSTRRESSPSLTTASLVWSLPRTPRTGRLRALVTPIFYLAALLVRRPTATCRPSGALHRRLLLFADLPLVRRFGSPIASIQSRSLSGKPAHPPHGLTRVTDPRLTGTRTSPGTLPR